MAFPTALRVIAVRRTAISAKRKPGTNVREERQDETCRQQRKQ
jgi:hypothetical protein